MIFDLLTPTPIVCYNFDEVNFCNFWHFMLFEKVLLNFTCNIAADRNHLVDKIPSHFSLSSSLEKWWELKK